MDLSGIPVLLSSDPLWFSYLECNRVLLKLLLILQAIDINSGQFPGTASEQKVPADPLYCTCIVCWYSSTNCGQGKITPALVRVCLGLRRVVLWTVGKLKEMVLHVPLPRNWPRGGQIRHFRPFFPTSHYVWCTYFGLLAYRDCALVLKRLWWRGYPRNASANSKHPPQHGLMIFLTHF